MKKDWVYRVVGRPPGSGAVRRDQLRWVRKFSWFGVMAIVVVSLFAALTGSAFLWIVAGFGALWSAASWISITRKIHSETSGPDRP
jgi:hypothetical protein